MDEQEIVDQFVEVVTNNVGAISSTRLNSQVLLTFSFAYGIITILKEQTKEFKQCCISVALRMLSGVLNLFVN